MLKGDQIMVHGASAAVMGHTVIVFSRDDRLSSIVAISMGGWSYAYAYGASVGEILSLVFVSSVGGRRQRSSGRTINLTISIVI